MKEKKPLLVYVEEGLKTLVIDGCIPFSTESNESSVEMFIGIFKPKDSRLIEMSIRTQSKGLDQFFTKMEEGCILVDVLFMKDVQQKQKYYEWKHFNYEDGYVLLPYLSGMHKGFFNGWLCQPLFLFLFLSAAEGGAQK